MKHLKITVDGQSFDVTVEELSEKKPEDMKANYSKDCAQKEKVEYSDLVLEELLMPNQKIVSFLGKMF